MSFIKKAKVNHNLEIEALNKPDWKIYNMTKMASVKKDKNDLGGFNIESAIKDNPDHLFVKIFAIKQDEVNDNGDAFCAEELKKAAETFIGVPVFCNHQNDDVEKARGKVVHAWYDERAEGIYIISMVDRVAYPKLARGIEEGYVNGSSMGCSVDGSVCSICHNAASNAQEYCNHVESQKNRKFSGKVKCSYHDSPYKIEGYEDICPICGSKKDEEKELEHKKAQVYEHNYGINFIEDSFVVSPACHSCLVQEVFNTSELSKKIAEIRDKVTKLSHFECNTSCDVNIKTAGRQEIEYLNDAMDKIERVSKSMMAQKKYVSMEFVSDLVEALANVQSIADELIEMGYEQLPSPEVSESSVSGLEGIQSQEPVPEPQETPPVKETPKPSGDVEVENLGDIGSVTKPSQNVSNDNQKYSEKKEEFIGLFSKFKDKIGVLSQQLDNFMQSNKENNIKESPEMSNIKKSDNREKPEKVAEHDTDVITEKQLNDAKFTGERWDEAPETITEKQLDDPTANKDPNTVTSESPQRSGSYEVITEKQLDAIKNGYVVRWADFPEVITEKQWTETARMIGSDLSRDQDDIITEKQLEDFVSKHSYPSPEIITEKQLAEQDGKLSRWASSDSKDIVKSAMQAMADAVAFYGKTPVEMKKAAAYVNQNAKIMDKAAYVTLMNALPHKKEDKTSEAERYSYFSKVASSVKAPNAVDSLLVCASNYIDHHSVDDILVAAKVIMNNEKGMQQVESLAKKKLQVGIEESPIVDKAAEFENAIKEIDRPEDGLYQVHMDLSEINADPKDKKAFLSSVVKVANKNINDPEIETSLLRVDMDQEKNVVVATLKDNRKLSKAEKKKVKEMNRWMQEKDEEVEDLSEFDSNEDLDKILASRKGKREELVKEAQMFGGQTGPGMGGEIPGGPDGGAGMGAGATLPQPPAGDAGLESFEESDMGENFAEGDETFEPTPPGTRCPVCGSEDVDVIKGEGRCNNCSSEMDYEINVKVKKWTGVTSDDVEDGDQEEDLGDEFEGEGYEMPAAASSEKDGKQRKISERLNVLKFAATTKITKSALEKIKENETKLGSVSPLTGSTNTLNLGNNQFICLDTGVPYSVRYAVEAKNPKNVYAQWSWNPDTSLGCEECSRTRKRFVKALSSMDISEDKFDRMDLKEKGKTILAMKGKGLLKNVKLASLDKASAINDYQNKFSKIASENFPLELCMQKLANRFGMDSVALSGPCEGKPIYDCVCKSLKNAGIYSNNMAVKVAEILSDKDGSSECIEDYVRLGFEYKQACTICDALKAKYAQFEDALVEEITVLEPEEGPDDDGGLSLEDEADPFGEDMEAGTTVNIDLPIDLVEELDKALDVALGEDPMEEEHHQDEFIEEIKEEDVEEAPEDAVEVVDEVADEVVNDELEEVEEDIEEEMEENEDQEMYMENETDPVGEEDVDVNNDGEVNEEDAYLLNRREEIAEDKGNDELEKEIDEVKEKVEKIEGEIEKNDNPGVLNEDETLEPVEKEGDEEESEDMEGMTMAENNLEQFEKEANSLKPGYIGRASGINLDLSGVMKVLQKQAAGDTQVQQQNAQDVEEIGKYKDGKPIKNENPVDEGGPDVPEKGDKAMLGNEEAIGQKGVKVPAGSDPMGGEEDNPKLGPGEATMTGGDDGAGSDGAGHTASTKDRINALADRIQKHKTAAEKKLEPKAPDSEDPDIQPVKGKDGSPIGQEDKFEAEDVEYEDVQDNEFIGKEKETFKDKPESPKDHPEVPVGEGKFPNEENEPEKGTKDIGIARNAKTVQQEATRIAGRMLESGQIKSDELVSKIEELSSYKLAQLKDIEKSIFANKGLNAVPDGLESPVVIGEESSEQDARRRQAEAEANEQDGLARKLASLFQLDRQNKEAQELDSNMRKVFNRG